MHGHMSVTILKIKSTVAFIEGKSFFSLISAVIFVSNEYNYNNIN
jgi:hypothetical protein